MLFGLVEVAQQLFGSCLGTGKVGFGGSVLGAEFVVFKAETVVLVGELTEGRLRVLNFLFEESLTLFTVEFVSTLAITRRTAAADWPVGPADTPRFPYIKSSHKH